MVLISEGARPAWIGLTVRVDSGDVGLSWAARPVLVAADDAGTVLSALVANSAGSSCQVHASARGVEPLIVRRIT